MIVSLDEIEKVKYPETFIYKVYSISSKMHYTGFASIAAISAEEANKEINAIQRGDEENTLDTWGWSSVSESDHYDLVSDKKGILENNIRYVG